MSSFFKCSTHHQHQVFPDLNYMPGSDLDAHKFDVYVPAASPPSAALIHIHGGGWVRGGRKSFAYGATAVCASLANKGILCFSVSYRLGTPHPASISDVAAAVAFILLRSLPHYALGDPSRVFLSGHSAGAHLISLLYADPAYLRAGCERLGAAPVALGDAVKGMVCLGGVYTLANPFGPDATTRASLFRSKYVYPIFGRDPEKLRAASPTCILAQMERSAATNHSRVAEEEAISAAVFPTEEEEGGTAPGGMIVVEKPEDGVSTLVWEEDSVSEESVADSEAQLGAGEAMSDLLATTYSPHHLLADAPLLSPSTSSSTPSSTSNATAGSISKPRFLIMNAQIDVGLEHDGERLFQILSNLDHDVTYLVVNWTNHITLSIKERVMNKIHRWIVSN